MLPTEEQIKKFWEWCGFKQDREYHDNGKSYFEYWINDDYREFDLPPMDLNNLFRYAVQKLQNYALTRSINGGNQAAIYIDGRWSGIMKNEDPALALFWAIYEVIDK